MSKDKFKEEEKRITAELMKKSKEQIIELYLQTRFERNLLQSMYDNEPRDEITGQRIYNVEVTFTNKEKTQGLTYPHRIKFYENNNCAMTIEMPDVWFEHPNLDKYVADLTHENKILAKALELACESVKYFEEIQDKEMGFSEFFGYDSDYDLQAIIEQYKQQAEKELKNE